MAIARRRRAVFLDKDGTLVEDVPYNADPLQMRFTPGAASALRALSEHGFRLIVVSNQPGIALGRFTEKALHAMGRHLCERFAAIGVALDGFYYCPHLPGGVIARYAVRCACRKPAPGLLVRAASEQYIDLARSWMVGDILDDIEAGLRAGCRTVLVDNGNETEWLRRAERRPHAAVADLPGAARFIVAHDVLERMSA